MSGLSHSPDPGIVRSLAAGTARAWQGAQDKVAQIFGFKNAGNVSNVVTIVGLTTIAVSSLLGPLGPAVYGAGFWTTGAGIGGIVENDVTKKLADLDGKGHNGV